MGPFLVILCHLILTILIEGAVIALWLKSKEAVVGSVYVNVLTNPPLNLILMLLIGKELSVEMVAFIRIVLEIAVVFIEALAYKAMLRISFMKALWMSFVLNLVSFAAGEFLPILRFA